MTLENHSPQRDDRAPAHSVSGVSVNRRNFVMNTVVSVASLASASAVAAPTAVPTQRSKPDDPIFAMIERHKAALFKKMKACWVRANTVDAAWADEYDAKALAVADEHERAALEEYYSVTDELVETQPTTYAGLMAFLAYVVSVNAGEFKLPDYPKWCSGPDDWPEVRDHSSGIDIFAHSQLEKVHSALSALSGDAPSFAMPVQIDSCAPVTAMSSVTSLIEAHRAARKAEQELSDKDDRFDKELGAYNESGQKPTAAWHRAKRSNDRKYERAVRATDACFDALWEHEPASRGEAIMLRNYLARDMQQFGAGIHMDYAEIGAFLDRQKPANFPV